MQQITGIISNETDLAIQIKTDTTTIWIPKRGIVDICPDTTDNSERMTYFVQDWVDLTKFKP